MARDRVAIAGYTAWTASSLAPRTALILSEGAAGLTAIGTERKPTVIVRTQALPQRQGMFLYPAVRAQPTAKPIGK